MKSRVQGVFRWLMLAVVFISSGAMAATLDVLVDRDNNTATGCTVSTPGGAFDGVEQIFTTTVDTTVFPAKITGISRQDCLTPPSTYSAPIPVDAGGWPVGVGTGTNGYDVVETYFTLSQQFGQLRLGFVYKDANTGQDALLSVNGQAGAAAIIAVIGPTPIIPTLTHGALLLLAFALGWLALRQLRRHKASTLIVVGVLATIVASTALATVVLDGLIADWAGVPPIATDAIGDAPAGADIAAVFIQVEAGRVYVRLDVKIATPPSITSANATAMTAGAAGNFAITTFGIPPVNSITETGALPAGVSFAYTAGQSTASLTGTPGANTGGVYPLLLTAKNGVTPDATQNFTLTVNQAPAITSVNTTTCFIGVTCTFSVTATGYPVPTITRGGAGLPSGLTYVDNGNGTGTLSGVADLGTAGPYALTFAAANGVGGNATQNFALNIAKAGTTTTITSSQNPSLVGQPVTFTATVKAQGNGTPGGPVQFKDGGANLGVPVALDGTGNATLTTSALTLGTHAITVDYPGDPNFIGSTGSLPTQTVNKASSTTTITSSVNPSTSGQSVTFTATVIATPPGSGIPTGTVQFMDGAVNLGAPAALNGAGIATLATTTLSPGAHAITANYSGDANFSTSTGSLPTQTVNKANTTTTLARTAGTDPSVFGQPLVFTATAAAVAPGAGTPTGTVTFKDGATTLCNAVALVAGVATCSTSTLATGAHSITADYSSDANFNASTSAAIPQTVNKANTTTVITNVATITATSSVVGEPYAVNVSVSPVLPGAGTPSGTITVGDGTATCTIALPATSCLLASTSPGPKTVTASYAGDTNFNTSNAPTAPHTVNKANTTTTITNAAALSATATVIGEAYAVNVAVAPVAPGAGTPTGTVTVGDGVATCTVTLPATSCNLTSATTGAKTITAQYNADTNFNGSAAATAAHSVNKPATTTTITNAATLTATPSVVGETYAVNWSVTVNPPGTLGAALTGTVTVSDGAQSCNAAVAAGTCNLTSTSPGVKTLTATYAGDPNYGGSASAGAPHTVTKASTSTTITNSLAASTVVGQPYTVNWTVAVVAPGSAAVVPLTGTVTVSDGTASCTAAVGAGTCTLTSTTSGAKTVVAIYAGDANYTTSASAGTAHTVLPAATTTTFTSSNNPSLSGSSVTFTATITPNAPGAGVPTGTVTFRDNATILGSVPLVAGVAQLTTNSLSPGVHPNINSNYPGDANFTGSASGSLSQTVNEPPIAVADTIYHTLHDTGLVVPAPGVLSNDNRGTPVATITHVNGVVCGAFPCAGTTTQGGNVSVNADGSFGFTPKSFFAGDDTFTYTLTNSIGTSTATVTVTVDDAAPVVDLNGNTAGIDFGPVVFNEGAGPLAIVGTVPPNALNVTDPDSANIGSATIVLTNIQDAGSEMLALTCPAAPAPACSGAIQTTDIAAPVITPTSYTITISRIAPPADYQALLRSLTYNNTSLNPTTGTNRLITLRVDDRIKDNAPLAQATVQVVGVNSPPSITAPAAVTTPKDTAFTFTGPNAVSIADPDAGAASVQLKITVVNGTASMTSFSSFNTLTFSASVASENASLATLQFTPTAGFTGAATLKIDVDDKGNSGTGGALTATKTINITVDTPPSVLSSDPADGATNVPTNKVITLTFSEPVTVDASAFALECPLGTPKAFTLNPVVPGPASVYTLTPTTPLPEGALCKVSAFRNHITDSAGQQLTSDLVAQFQVNTLPTVQSTVPADTATGVLTGSQIAITFTESVAATGSAFTLECPAGTARTFSMSASPAMTYTLTPSVALPNGTACKVTVVANQITDGSGQTMAANYVFNFTAGTPPTISSANTATFVVGANGTFTVTTTGSPTGAAMVIGETGAVPAGVTFVNNNNGTATISGTPAAGTAADYPIVISAANGNAPAASQNFTLVVNQAPVANNDSYTTPHDTPLTVLSAAGVLVNDTGRPTPTVNGIVGGPAACSVGAACTTPAGGSVTLQSNGGFVYTPPAAYAGNDTFVYTVTNSVGTSAPATVTIAVTNVAPIVDLDGASSAGIDFGPVTFTEAGGAVAIVGTAPPNALTITDTDSANLVSASVTITNVMDAAAESLSVTCPSVPAPACSGAIQTTDIVVTPGGATATLTITRSAPKADYEALLRTLKYDNSSQNPTTAADPSKDRTITVTVNDGISNNAPLAQSSVHIVAVNNAPTITAPSNVTTPLNTEFVFTAGSAVSVSDPDSGSNAVSVVLTATDGQVTGLGSTAGLTVTGSPPAASVSLSGPIANVNTALAGLKFTATNNYSGPPSPTLKIDIDDLGNTGTGGSKTATKTVTITIQASPAILSADNTTFTVGQAGTFTITTSGTPTVTSIVKGGAALPANVTFTYNNNGTATLAGTPAAGTANDYVLTFTASNGVAPDAVQNPFTLHVVKQTQSVSFTSTAPASAKVGGATYLVAATATSGLPVSFTVDASATSVCSIAGSTVSFIGVGTCVIDANQAGDGTFSAATQVQQSFAVAKGDQTISFTSAAPGGAKVGGSTYNVTATATSGLPVSFTIDPSATAVCSIAGSTVSFLSVGTCVIDANQAGNANYNAATQAQQSFAVAKGDQTISFTSTAPAGAKVGGATYTVSATSSSGLAVTAFTIDPAAISVCSISGTTVAFIGAGTCVIDANQSGNSNYNAATQAQQSFVVAKGDQTITFTSTAPSNAKVGGPTYTVTATATSGLPVAFTIDAAAAAVCSIAGSTVSFTGTGNCVIDANQAGNANWNAATQVQQTFAVFRAPQITSANAVSFTSTDPGTFTVTTTGVPTNAAMVISESGLLPSGVTFVNNNNGTATLAGTPAAGTQGNYVITIMASNGVSPDATQSFTLTVLNKAPVLTNNPISYTTPGNTQLHVAGATLPGVAAWTDAQSAMTKSAPTDVDGPVALTVVPDSGTTGNGGSYSIASNGAFTYVPAAGFTGGDSFTYKVTDSIAQTSGTINVTVGQRVWYIRDVIDANNAAGGDGRSTNAFDTVAAFNAATTNNSDIIFIFRGNTGTTPLGGAAGITLKDGQKLWGEGIGLTVPSFGTLVAAGSQPKLSITGDAVSVPATAGSRQNVEIRGLDLASTSGNAIDVTATGANNVGITISNNTISGSGLEGMDLNAGTTGTFTATVQNNAVSATGNAIDIRTSAAATMTLDVSGNAVAAGSAGIVIDGSGSLTTTITGFAGNSINGAVTGTGISVTSAKFDQTPGGAFQTVNAGNLVIGAAGNGVGGSGMLLQSVSGDLAFTDMDIFADGGAGLRANGTTPYTGSAGFQITVPAGVANVTAIGGPAVDLTTLNANVQFVTISSTNSVLTGVSLDTVTGTFAAGLGSTITNASGTDFNINAGTVNSTYNGTITDSTGRLVSITNTTGGTKSFTAGISDSAGGSGTGIFLNSNTNATISFSGGIALSTGSNAAFTATNGGIVTVTQNNGSIVNTLATGTGTALNVANTTIGASGLTFRSISANGGANGIILDTTGASGGLTVTGGSGANSRDNSGGTIQASTGVDGTTQGHCVYLNSTSNVSLNFMNIHNCQGDGIHGNAVNNFTLSYTNMTTNGTTTSQLGNFHGEGDVNMVTLSGAGSVHHNNFQLAFYNTFGVFNDVTPVTLNRMVMSNNTFGANDINGGNAGVVFRADGGVMNVTFGSDAATSNTITGAGSNTFILDLHGLVSSDLIMKNNAISNNHGNIVTGGGGVSLQSGGVGDQVTLTFNVDSNTFSGSHGAGFFIGTGQLTNGNTFTGTFNNNTIGIQGTANSGSTTGNDLFLDNEGSITNITVTNNKLYQYNPNGTGALQLQVANDNGHVAHATLVVTGNTISNPGTNAPAAAQTFNGIQLNAGTAMGDTAKTNLTLYGNTVAGSGNAATGSTDIRLRQRFSATIGLFGNGSNYGGTPNDTTAIANFAVAQNGGTASAVSSAPGGFFGTVQ